MNYLGSHCRCSHADCRGDSAFYTQWLSDLPQKRLQTDGWTKDKQCATRQANTTTAPQCRQKKRKKLHWEELRRNPPTSKHGANNGCFTFFIKYSKFNLASSSCAFHFGHSQLAKTRWQIRNPCKRVQTGTRISVNRWSVHIHTQIG